jgi:spore coat protein U-like protein
MSLFKKTLVFFAILGFTPAVSAVAFNCNVSVGSLNFPTYNFLSSQPTDSTAAIHVSCNIPDQNPHAPLMVTLSLSSGNSGSFSQRQMVSGAGNGLSYNLFTDASYSSIWGDGTGSSATRTRPVTRNSPWNAVVFGRIPARQNVQAGTYSDTITVTVEW